MKKCSSCQQFKDPILFNKCRGRPDGLNVYCRECGNRKCREYRLNNPTKWEIQKNKNFKKWREKLCISEQELPRRRKRGEGYITRDGYMTYHFKNHPCADKNGRVQASHKVYYEHTGKLLMKGETIHHKNGDRLDNRIENLELCTINHPHGQRVDDKIKWCIEFLDQYGYDVKKRE